MVRAISEKSVISSAGEYSSSIPSVVPVARRDASVPPSMVKDRIRPMLRIFFARERIASSPLSARIPASRSWIFCSQARILLAIPAR